MENRNEKLNDARVYDQADDDEPLPPEGHPAQIAVGRYLSDTLALWRLCESSHCKRGRRCMGVPPACLETCLPLLSDDVREGGVAFVQGKAEKLNFDELMEESKELIMAMAEWKWRIDGCASPPAARKRAASAAP